MGIGDDDAAASGSEIPQSAVAIPTDDAEGAPCNQTCGSPEAEPSDGGHDLQSRWAAHLDWVFSIYPEHARAISDGCAREAGLLAEINAYNQAASRTGADLIVLGYFQSGDAFALCDAVNLPSVGADPESVCRAVPYRRSDPAPARHAVMRMIPRVSKPVA